MKTNTLIKIKTIAEYHALRGLPKPKNPLISVIYFDDVQIRPSKGTEHICFDYYTISVKRHMNHFYKYGQQKYEYDFNDGIMFFMAPNQVLSIEIDDDTIPPSGWMLMIHPDFLWNTSLASNIKKFNYFDYSANEALFLSEDEEKIINNVIENIQSEYVERIDNFSKHIIISQLETLLNYSDRFYQRQFITRQKVNHEIITRFEEVLENYVNNESLTSKGLPSVQYISDSLNVSSGYLLSLLKQLTGKSTQQLIHEKLIEKAKEKLSTTSLSISEISFQLGFEHSQSFSKLFKNKTNQSPLDFRRSFN